MDSARTYLRIPCRDRTPASMTTPPSKSTLRAVAYIKQHGSATIAEIAKATRYTRGVPELTARLPELDSVCRLRHLPRTRIRSAVGNAGHIARRPKRVYRCLRRTGPLDMRRCLADGLSPYGNHACKNYLTTRRGCLKCGLCVSISSLRAFCLRALPRPAQSPPPAARAYFWSFYHAARKISQ